MVARLPLLGLPSSGFEVDASFFALLRAEGVFLRFLAGDGLCSSSSPASEFGSEFGSAGAFASRSARALRPRLGPIAFPFLFVAAFLVVLAPGMVSLLGRFL